MLKISDFYLDKQKSFILKKILGVPIVLFSANRWPLNALTFLVHGFAFNYVCDIVEKYT